MKKFAVVLVALVALSAAGPASALEVSGDAYVGVSSKYLWRGFDLSPDDAFVVQPGADVSIGGFTVSWWGNMSENTGEMNEVDLTLDYSADLGDLVSVSVGNILYDVDGLKDTNELYLGVSLNTLLSPSLTGYYDYDEFDGNYYLVLGIGHDFEINDRLSASVGVTGSYLHDDALDDSWLHIAELTAGVDYAITDKISAGVSALYFTKLDDKAEDYTGEKDGLTGALTVAVSF